MGVDDASRGRDREPSLDRHREPSRDRDREPSRDRDRERHRDRDREPPETWIRRTLGLVSSISLLILHTISMHVSSLSCGVRDLGSFVPSGAFSTLLLASVTSWLDCLWGARLLIRGWAKLYVKAHEWCFACVGWLDPCSGNDVHPRRHLQLTLEILFDLEFVLVSCVEYLQ